MPTTAANRAIVMACLRNGRRQCLITSRPAGKRMAGAWEFPGGKVETGESLTQALVRELHEELDITTNETAFLPVTRHNTGRLALHLFFYPHAIDEVTAQEGQDIQWITPPAFPIDKMLPANKHLIVPLLILINHYDQTPSH